MSQLGYQSVRFLLGDVNAWRGERFAVHSGWDSDRVPTSLIKVEVLLAQRIGALARTHDEMSAYLKAEEVLSEL